MYFKASHFLPSGAFNIVEISGSEGRELMSVICWIIIIVIIALTTLGMTVTLLKLCSFERK